MLYQLNALPFHEELTIYRLKCSSLQITSKAKMKGWKRSLLPHWDGTQQQLLFQKSLMRTPLVDQGLWLQAPNAGGPGSTPGQGPSSHMLQLRVPTTKTARSQINKCFKKIITKSLMDKKLCWGHLSEAGEYLKDESPISSLVWYIMLQSQLEVGLSKGYLQA